MIVTTRRIILAIFLAPLIAPIVLVVSYGALQLANEHELRLIFFLALPYTYLVAFFVGLPVYFLLNHFEKLSFLTISIAGITIALIPYAYLTLPLEFESRSIGITVYLANYFLIAACGFLVAAVFCLLSGVGSRAPHNQNLQRDASPAARRG